MGNFQKVKLILIMILSLFLGIKKYEKVKIPGNLNAELRPYPEVGFLWLLQNINLGFGSVLADDRGLGKTLQVST